MKFNISNYGYAYGDKDMLNAPDSHAPWFDSTGKVGGKRAFSRTGHHSERWENQVKMEGRADKYGQNLSDGVFSGV